MLGLSRFAIENAADGIAWINREGEHQYVNPALCRWLGYSREELLDLTVVEVNPGFTRETWARHWEVLRQSGKLSFETELRRRDGRLVAAEITASLLGRDGEDYCCAFIRDVTERKASEEASRRGDVLQRIAGRVARLGGWAVDLGEQRVLWSDEVCAIHDMPAGHSPTVEQGIRFYAPEWRDRILNAFEACARDGRPYDEEMEIVTARGRRVWVRTAGEPVRDHTGRITHVQGAFQDISDRKEAERSLAQSQRRFRELADAMPMIVWTARPDGVVDYCNDAFTDYAGVTSAELKHQGWLDPVHPEDRAPCLAAWAESVAAGEPYSIELRIRRSSDGCYRWYLVRAVPIRNDSGEIVTWYGTGIDIDDRKAAEGRFSRLASRLQNTLESITDAFYTLDREWRFSYVNGEAERLLKRDRAYLLGKVIWEVFPALIDTRIHVEYQSALSGQRSVHFEVLSPTLDMWQEVHAYPSDEGLTVYFRDISERKRAEADIQFLALYDTLTKLPNRRLLQDRLQHALDAGARSGQLGAVLFLDLDQFKTLNDTTGHDFGDLLLQQVAERLKTCLRQADTVGRFGGDEFVIVLADLGEAAEAAAARAGALGEKILAALDRPYRLGAHERHITCSVGITLFDGRRDSVGDVLKRADFAMYQAKADGRNALRMFDPAMQAAVNARVELEAQMRRALQQREFVAYLQPQMDGAGRLIGAEALARWHHPERERIAPAEFIPVAEETGLILPLGAQVLEQACQQLAQWADSSATACLSMAVNISARQFRHPDFVSQVLGATGDAGADPRKLTLEITESLLLHDMDDTITKMTALQQQGVSFSLDDFGTGYSSLYYLKRLPLKQLKIDQRFVQGVLTDPTDAAIVRAIIGLAKSLGVRVIAEGVETGAMRDFLMRHGCKAFQGYLFAPPLPPDEFERYRRTLPAGVRARG
jgi:diguanylate cyclase (GGDEF)-like protein/PAS domain S-box-containing protein